MKIETHSLTRALAIAGERTRAYLVAHAVAPLGNGYAVIPTPTPTPTPALALH